MPALDIQRELRRLGVPIYANQSYKLDMSGVTWERGMYGAPIDDRVREQLPRICRNIEMPDDIYQAYLEALGDATHFSFGYVSDLMLKAYLEHAEEGNNRAVGYKWHLTEFVPDIVDNYAQDYPTTPEGLSLRMSELSERNRAGVGRVAALVFDFTLMRYGMLETQQGPAKRSALYIQFDNGAVSMSAAYGANLRTAIDFGLEAAAFDADYLTRTAGLDLLWYAAGADEWGNDYVNVYYGNAEPVDLASITM